MVGSGKQEQQQERGWMRIASWVATGRESRWSSLKPTEVNPGNPALPYPQISTGTDGKQEDWVLGRVW